MAAKKAYVFARDDSGHWYLIPKKDQKKFTALLENEDPQFDSVYGEDRINDPGAIIIHDWSDR